MSNTGPTSVKSLAKRFQYGQANNAIGSTHTDTTADRALALEAHNRALAAQAPDQLANQRLENDFETIYAAQLELLGDVDKALSATEKLMGHNEPPKKPVTVQYDADKYAQSLQDLMNKGVDFDVALEQTNNLFSLS